MLDFVLYAKSIGKKEWLLTKIQIRNILLEY